MPLLGSNLGFVGSANTAQALELGAGFVASGLLAYFRSRFDGVATWSLQPTDESIAYSGIVLSGDGEPESFRPVDATNVAASSGFQVFDPITLPTGAEATAWEISHLYVPEDRTVDLRIVERVLALFRKRFAELRRPPILRLQYGDTNERVWLTGVEAEYPYGMWDGSDIPVALRIRIRLTKCNLRSLRERPVRPRETTYRTLRAGETFEDVALEAYGDPGMGVIIRRINPDILEEYPGARIKILDRGHPKVRTSTAPASPIFLERYAELVNAAAERKAEQGAVSWAALEAEATVADGTPSLYDEGDA